MERFRRVAPLHVLQPPYNLFERGIEADLLPYCRKNSISTFGYGALCRGLLSGRMRPDSKFEGDDLRRTDPKFQQPRFGEYLAAVTRLDQLAQQRFRKRVIHLAVRWMLDQGITTALWGARHPGQLDPVDEVSGWHLDAPAKAEIDRILAASAIRWAPNSWRRRRAASRREWEVMVASGAPNLSSSGHPPPRAKSRMGRAFPSRSNTLI